jgi:uncharacterized protein (TIGR03086 family)
MTLEVSKTVTLPVTPDEAFALITEPARLRRWHTISARVDLRVGGDYRWTIVPGHTAVGHFQEIEPGKRVVFGWGWDGDQDFGADASTVHITLTPVAGGTELTLLHTGVHTEEQVASHTEGWTHYLGRLEKVAETGDAGADEWAAAPRELNEITAADAALAVLQNVLRQLTVEDQPKQTPCEDFTCHGLALHLFTSLEQLGGMAGATIVNPGVGSLENKIAVMGADTIDAWRARGLEGTIPGPGGREMPAAYAASILPVELLLHAWDMSQGSGKPITASDELVAYIAKLAEQIVPGGRGRSFADEIVPDVNASALDRLAAFAGRTPIAS